MENVCNTSSGESEAGQNISKQIKPGDIVLVLDTPFGDYMTERTAGQYIEIKRVFQRKDCLDPNCYGYMYFQIGAGRHTNTVVELVQNPGCGWLPVEYCELWYST